MSKELKQKILQVEKENGTRMIDLRRNYNSILLQGGASVKLLWKKLAPEFLSEVTLSSDGRQIGFLTEFLREYNEGQVLLVHWLDDGTLDRPYGFDDMQFHLGITRYHIESTDQQQVELVAIIPENVVTAGNGWNDDGEATKTIYGFDDYDDEKGNLLRIPGDNTNWCALSSDGSRVAYEFDDGTDITLHVRDLKSGDERTLHVAGKNHAFSHDGSKLAFLLSPERSQQIKVLDVHTGSLWTLTVHPLSKFELSYDGMMVAEIYGKRVKVWDLTSGECLQILDHSTSVDSASFSPNGKMVATTSENNTIIWSVKSGSVMNIIRELEHEYNMGDCEDPEPSWEIKAKFATNDVIVADVEFCEYRVVKVYEVKFTKEKEMNNLMKSLVKLSNTKKRDADRNRKHRGAKRLYDNEDILKKIHEYL